MADERTLIYAIRKSLDKLQRALPISQKRANSLDPLACKRDDYFMGGLIESRSALVQLQTDLLALSDVHNGLDTHDALNHAHLLARDIEGFLSEPVRLKPATALGNLDKLIAVLQKIDPTYARSSAPAVATNTLSPDQRKALFLNLWSSERGLGLMRSILENFIALKKLIIHNTLLARSGTLDVRSQGRTITGETQVIIEKRLTTDLQDLQAKVFKPCLIEGDVAVFYGRSPFRSRLARSCPIRKVFLDQNPLEDPVVLIASDLLCALTLDMVDVHIDPAFQDKINAQISAPILVRALSNLKDAIKDLAELVPRDAAQLKEVFIRLVDTEAARYDEIARYLIAQYPSIYWKATREDLIKGL